MLVIAASKKTKVVKTMIETVLTLHFASRYQPYINETRKYPPSIKIRFTKVAIPAGAAFGLFIFFVDKYHISIM